MGVPTGNNVGTAVGAVVINTTQAQQAPTVMRGVAQGINQAMASVNSSVTQGQQGLNALTGTLRGVGAAFGVTFGMQTIGQLVRFAVESDRIATAYDRQLVAARSLAGSQAELNELLTAYQQATGGAVDEATALADVTRLQAVGFADSAKELEEFTRAARGISVATGQQQDYVISQLQLAIANQSTLRLDQLGLGVTEVEKRIKQLRATNKGLTDEMAYQQAVLGLATEKFGVLTTTVAGQATGTERARAAWKNLRLEMAQDVQVNVQPAANALADLIEWYDKLLERKRRFNEEGTDLAILELRDRARESGEAPRPTLTSGERAWLEDAGGRTNARRGSRQGNTWQDNGTEAVRMDWAEGLVDIQERTNQQLTEENASYQRNRLSAERNYQKSVVREAEDFAINRRRQEQELADSILEVHEDAAQRELKLAEDLARSIGRMQSDSAEQLAEMARDRDERVAEAREDSQERLLELEADYNKAREEAAEDHRLKLLEAAGRLDARAIFLEQQRFKEQEGDAKEAYDEQRDSIQERLQEQLEDIEKAYSRRVEDEQKALAKSIAQANEAHARQLADARAADAQRITDMQADFAKRTEQEDADRALRLARMAEDFGDQMTEMDRQHGERIGQIIRHAQAERTELDDQAKEDLLALGVRNDAWLGEQERKEGEMEKLWDKFWDHLQKTFEGANPLPPGAPAGEDALPPGFAGASSIPLVGVSSALGMGGGGTFSIGDVHVSVAGSNASAMDIASAVRVQLGQLLREMAG